MWVIGESGRRREEKRGWEQQAWNEEEWTIRNRRQTEPQRIGEEAKRLFGSMKPRFYSRLKK